MPNAKSPPAATKKVRLVKPHEHAGRAYAPGNIIELAMQDADWLIAIGRAEPIND